MTSSLVFYPTSEYCFRQGPHYLSRVNENDAQHGEVSSKSIHIPTGSISHLFITCTPKRKESFIRLFSARDTVVVTMMESAVAGLL